jgi:hypothetical protein
VSTGIHGGQGTNPNGLHARVLDKIKYSREAVGQSVPEWFNKLEQQPADGAVEGQAQAFYKTWLEFTTIHKDKKAIILLVNPNKRSPPSHFSEKKWVQFTLEDIASKEGKGLPRVEVITFDECSKRSVTQSNTIQLAIRFPWGSSIFQWPSRQKVYKGLNMNKGLGI